MLELVRMNNHWMIVIEIMDSLVTMPVFVNVIFYLIGY